MKFNCGLSREERFEAKVKKLKKANQDWIQYAAQWHTHFVRWPTRVGPNDCRWLETVERRARYTDSYYDTELGIWISYVRSWDYRPLGGAVSQSVQQSP